MIESPGVGSELYGENQKNVNIVGQTEAGVTLTINDRIATVSETGSFNFSTTLSEGENQFTLKAQDRAGNEAETSLTLRFTP